VNSGNGRWVVSLVIAVILLLCGKVSAQNKPVAHHHYELLDIGTLGGPNSSYGWAFGRSINSSSTAISDTLSAAPSARPLTFFTAKSQTQVRAHMPARYRRI